MSQSFSVYDLASGRIKRSGTLAESLPQDQARAGEGVVLSLGMPHAHYVSEGTLTERPSFDFLVSQDPFRVENIPTGTLVKHPGGELIVDDGFIEWTSVEPGEYAFHFENFPYIEETVHAVVSDL